jgi:hypothetical protein
MTGDIIQDQQDGSFYRDNGDGTYDDLSETNIPDNAPPPRVAPSCARKPVLLVRNGTRTGLGDSLAGRVAVVMARRYA